MVVLLPHTTPLTLQGISFNTACSELTCFLVHVTSNSFGGSRKRDIKALKCYILNINYLERGCMYSITARKSKAI
jgi:hypothetical protein